MTSNPSIQTKSVTRGIYNRVSTGRYVGNVEQCRLVETGKKVTNYTFEVVNNAILKINDIPYRVEDNMEFAIKIMRTKIKAVGGAPGLMNFLLQETLDNWETKVIQVCRPVKMN